MSSVSMAFGSTLCSVVQYASGSTPRCYNPTDVAFVGSLFMTFLVVLTIGWQVARRA